MMAWDVTIMLLKKFATPSLGFTLSFTLEVVPEARVSSVIGAAVLSRATRVSQRKYLCAPCAKFGNY